MELNVSRLCSYIQGEKWDDLLNILKPKFFPRDERGKLTNPFILAKVAETLIEKKLDLPDKVKIVLLKCLMNSCVHGYKHKEYNTLKNPVFVNSEHPYTIWCEIYLEADQEELPNKYGYPIFTHFPYDGIAMWTVQFISEYSTSHTNLSDDQLEILRLSVQFLCNLATFACKNTDFPEYESPPRCFEDLHFKEMMLTLVRHDHIPVSRSACAYVHNTLTLFPEKYYTDDDRDRLTVSLMKPIKIGILPAIDSLAFLLKRPKQLERVYETIPMENRLYLLETFHQKLSESVSDEDIKGTLVDFLPSTAEFLAERFRRKSDLILKTVDSYLDGTEPMEIMILLEILGSLTSRTSAEDRIANVLRNDRSLLVNCVYLLKSLHMVGKASSNHFTPVQKLSELAPGAQELRDDDHNNASSKNEETISDKKPSNVGVDSIQKHPAFGFKAGLIRVIGNMVHGHRGNQNLLRETDSISLLLDCCNMDARNPLILQWTIFALRNVCETNVENQDIIRKLNKVGTVDSKVLHEMGLTLHQEDDGKTIGVMPLNVTK